MQRVIASLIFLSLALPIKASADTWDLWKTCPETTSAFTSRLREFDSRAESAFSGLSGTKLRKIYARDDREAALLRFISPYLLPSSIAAAVDTGCWVFYEDFKEQVDGADFSAARADMDGWRSCLETKHKEVPAPVRPLMACFDKVGK